MQRALWIASTGMQAQTLNIDVIANNLANVNTTGFKRSRADFQDLLYHTIRSAGTTSAQGSEVPTGIQVGHGTRPVATQKIFSQGDYQQTENQLDMAIEGNGFFQIIQPNGETAYSRAGAFKLDGQGRIVTSDGFLLEPEISIPTDATSISIGTDGTVSIKQAGETEPERGRDRSACHVYQPERVGKHWKKFVSSHKVFGRGDDGYRRRGRIRHHFPGVFGDVQCQRG